MRAAVYSGTRNIYEQMLTAAKSLLVHSNVEKIYFLIEDDEFPYELPEEIECINISNQTYFRPDSPNFSNVLSYMVLIRVAYTKIFPDLDRILTIDVDTIVNENISDLWDLDLTDYYLAGVEEVIVSKQEGSYINMGVAMLNLKKIRDEHKDDELIHNLNTYWYRWNEQDAINQMFRGQILILPSDYNACWQSKPVKHEKITHFAGIYDLKHFPNFDYYHNLPLDQIERNVQDNITLDIIIPTYNNPKKLDKTLRSIIPIEDINIIIVDDGSTEDYSSIIEEYPDTTFYHLDENVGPGRARQYGYDHSTGTYVMFLDAGDYFYDGGLKEIMKQIKENTYIKMYSWSYVYDKNNVLMDQPDLKMISKVFKRSFIDMYHIHFCAESSYANEDYGFIYACKLIFGILEGRQFSPAHKHIKIPVVYEHYDNTSITKANNHEYSYTKIIKGLGLNHIHAIQIAKPYNLQDWTIMTEMCHLMAYEYFLLLRIAQEHPEYLEDAWQDLRDIYFKTYYIYQKFGEPTLKKQFTTTTMPLVRKYIKNWTIHIPLNIVSFVKELESEKFVPLKYYG